MDTTVEDGNQTAGAAVALALLDHLEKSGVLTRTDARAILEKALLLIPPSQIPSAPRARDVLFEKLRSLPAKN